MLWLKRKNLSWVASVAVLAIAVGQVVFLTHTVIADHDLGEVCEICVGFDRITGAVASELPRLDIQPTAISSDPSRRVAVSSRTPRSVRARAPPNL